MIVREMTESDCGAIGELYAAAWKEGYKGLIAGELLDKLTPEAYAVRARANGFLDAGSFVVVESGRIAAHCHSRAANEPQMQGWGEIHTLYTHPDFWRQGFGAAVLRRAEEWLAEQGYKNAYLYVLEGNERAERFYKAQGYFPNGDTLCCDLGGVIVTDNMYVKCNI